MKITKFWGWIKIGVRNMNDKIKIEDENVGDEWKLGWETWRVKLS